MTIEFDTITFSRDIACSPEHLFKVMTDRTARETWGAPSDAAAIIIDEFDLRPGGQEIARCGPRAAPEFRTVTDFHVIDPPNVLISTETLEVGGALVSVSQCTSEITGSQGQSSLTVTLQIASLEGSDLLADYTSGWTAALDTLARYATQNI